MRVGIAGAKCSIAAHADRMPAFLQGLDEPVFVFRQNAREDRELLRSDVIGYRDRRADLALDPYLPRDCRRGRRGVAGHHYRSHAKIAQFADKRRRVRLRRIAERDEASQSHCARRTCGHGQHPIALPLKHLGG